MSQERLKWQEREYGKKIIPRRSTLPNRIQVIPKIQKDRNKKSEKRNANKKAGMTEEMRREYQKRTIQKVLDDMVENLEMENSAINEYIINIANLQYTETMLNRVCNSNMDNMVKIGKCIEGIDEMVYINEDLIQSEENNYLWWKRHPKIVEMYEKRNGKNMVGIGTDIPCQLLISNNITIKRCKIGEKWIKECRGFSKVMNIVKQHRIKVNIGPDNTIWPDPNNTYYNQDQSVRDSNPGYKYRGSRWYAPIFLKISDSYGNKYGRVMMVSYQSTI